MTPAYFLEFRSSLSVEPEAINQIFIALRAFFDYLVRIERLSINPLTDISALKSKTYVPYVFSPQQIESLLQVVEKKIRSNSETAFLRDLAVYSVISLMAHCGLRISEPLRRAYVRVRGRQKCHQNFHSEMLLLNEVDS